MDNTQTLELQVQSTAEGAIKSLKVLNTTLMGTKDATNQVYKSTNNLKDILIKGGVYTGFKRLTKQMLNWMDLAVDRTEQLNLFNVVFNNIEKNGVKTFSTLGKEATKFQNKLNESFGTNLTETTKYHALFQSMGENVGIEEKYSALMSETMTKLTYDLASLYNKEEKTTAEALRAGVYAGQTKPLRSYGIDVTQTSLQPILDSLGISDRSIKQMSQAEKEILRYLATLKQARVAMGDFANTVESPSNQIKIFRQQLVETKVALSSLFIGTYSNILPYANAILMIIEEMAEALADILGIELVDYNSGIASTEDAYIGLSDSIDGATDSIKELKRQTLGFDQINNLKEDDDSSNGSSLVGGVDQRLLDAIYGYDNGMDKVRMKATQIRDCIMDWLGYTKQIDPLTGDISFKLRDGMQNLHLILGIVGTIAGFKIVSTLTKTITGTNKLGKLLGTSGLFKTLKNLIEPIKVLGAKDGLHYIFLEGASAVKKFLPVATKVVGAIGGIAGVVVGSGGAYGAMKDLTVSSEEAGNKLAGLALGLTEATAGGAILGSVIPGVGTLIGALSGAVIGLTSSLLGYNKGLQELAEQELFGTINMSSGEWLEILNKLDTKITDNTVRFNELSTSLNKLKDTFDDNASKLDKYGLKFGTLAQQITEEDSKNIINAISDMCTSANDIIEETTDYSLELWGETFNKMSTITEDEEKDILNSILNYGDKQKQELKDAQDNITETYKNAINTRGYLTDEEYKYISEQLKRIRELTNKEMSLSQTDIEYYKTLFADRNQKLDQESYDNYKNALDSYHDEKLKAIEDTYNQEYNMAKNLLAQNAITQEQFSGMIKTAYEQRNKDVKELDKEIEEYTNKVVSGLKIRYQELIDDNTSLGKKQKKIIEDIFKDLNIDVSELKKSFQNAGKSCAVDFSNGISNNLRVDGSGLYTSWNSTLNKFNSGFNNNSLGLSNPFEPLKIRGFANGGFPEDGLFFANHNELVGEFSNGKTAVANNEQITEGIKRAVMEGMAQVFGVYGTQVNEIEVHVHSDEGVVVDKINQKTKQTGVCPIMIPVS